MGFFVPHNLCIKIFKFLIVTMVIIYSLVLLATAGTAGAYIWKRKPGLVVKTFMRYFLYTSGLRVKHIQVGPYRIAYAERGLPSDKPSLLFVHGFSSSKDMWVAVVRKLPKDLHIIVVDLPGHGDSSIPEEDQDITLQTMARHIRQFAEVVGLTRQPFHLAGSSMGGAIAALYAAYFPDDLDRVTLMCPAMRTPEQTSFQEEVSRGECQLLPQTAEEFKAMMDLVTHKKVKLGQTILEGCVQLREPKQHFYKRLFEVIMETDSSKEGRELEEQAAKIHLPTQVMWGKEDQVIHVSGAETLRERLPCCARVDILDECGHSCSMERPGLVAKLLLAFRNQSEKGVTNAHL